MARKSKTKARGPIAPDNKLKHAIENGGKIKGLEGFIRYYAKDYDEDDNKSRTFIPVRVLGIKTGEDSCTIEISVEIIGGYGTFTINPCRFINDLETIAHILERERIVNDAYRLMGEVRTGYTQPQKRSRFLDVLGTLDDNLKAKFDAEIEEIGGKSKLATDIIRDMMRRLIQEKFGLTDDELETADRDYWR